MRREYRGRLAAHRVWPLGAALLRVSLAALALLLAACAGSNNSATHAPTATVRSAISSPTSNATPATISTPGAPQGIAGLCAQPASVSAELPADIPPYPSAQLHIASNQNGSGLFGYCSTATVADVNSFYSAKIPENGWQTISTSSVGGTDQLTASKGSTTLTITILTDSQVSGDTDIVIVTSASGS